MEAPTTETSSEINTVQDFQDYVSRVEGKEGYSRPHAFGVGLATKSEGGARLDTWFPVTNLGENFGAAAALADTVGRKGETGSYTLTPEQIQHALQTFKPFLDDGKSHPNIEALKSFAHVMADTRREIVATFIGQEVPGITDVSDAYLRLHLLSHRKVKPNDINLDGLFGKLQNVAWTNEGPIAIDELDKRRMEARLRGQTLTVYSQDKIPAMLDYVTPDPSVRITNARNVRLGAYVGPGTTVMTAGAMNYNSGTVGKKAMIEGRISQGVTVGTSDLGGGASTQGTLSGGGKEKIVIGDECLIGANAGTGISLGDRCTIDAGLYITAGTKVFDLDSGKVVKASTLSGKPDLFFRQDSQSGRVEVRNKANAVALNDTLHG